MDTALAIGTDDVLAPLRTAAGTESTRTVASGDCPAVAGPAAAQASRCKLFLTLAPLIPPRSVIHLLSALFRLATSALVVALVAAVLVALVAALVVVLLSALAVTPVGLLAEAWPWPWPWAWACGCDIPKALLALVALVAAVAAVAPLTAVEPEVSTEISSANRSLALLLVALLPAALLVAALLPKRFVTAFGCIGR